MIYDDISFEKSCEDFYLEDARFKMKKKSWYFLLLSQLTLISVLKCAILRQGMVPDDIKEENYTYAF